MSDLRASYWFIPGALTLGAVLLGALAVWIDTALTVDGTPPDLPGSAMQPEGARALLSVLAQSIFGVTGVMYSMTLVAVSFASGKFGPRLIGNFMRDRVNQWSLGILIATFVYNVVILRAIHDGEDAPQQVFVPHLSIMLALALTLICIGVVIYFVHHIPEMIDISKITAGLGRRLIEEVTRLAEAQSDIGDDGFRPPPTPPDATLVAGRAGYLQAIDLDQLRSAAEEGGYGIDVPHPVGTFLSQETVMLRIWGGLVSDEVERDMRGSMAMGEGPTETQNVLFLMDQLVEIAARALSPGVNDPFTAIACVNWMRAGIVAGGATGDGLAGRQEGPVHLPQPTFRGLLDRSFENARPYTSSDPLCDRHVGWTLDRIEAELPPGPHLETFRTFRDGLRDGKGQDAVRGI
nr:DUF2254 domain-containing protein [Jannaschia sp. S6380]